MFPPDDDELAPAFGSVTVTVTRFVDVADEYCPLELIDTATVHEPAAVPVRVVPDTEQEEPPDVMLYVFAPLPAVTLDDSVEVPPMMMLVGEASTVIERVSRATPIVKMLEVAEL